MSLDQTESYLTPQAELLQTYLEQAQEYLAQNNFPEVKNSLEQILNVAGNHPDREDKIRQLLQKYVDDQKSSEPNWSNINQAINLLNTLNLHTAETQIWAKETKLDEGEYYLGKERINESFELFTKLIGASNEEDRQDLRMQVAERVRGYLMTQAIQHKWAVFLNVIEHIQSLWPPNHEQRKWLEMVSEVLAEAKQEQDKSKQEQDESKQKIIDFNKKLEQATQESKKYFWAFIALAICASMIIVILTFVS